MNKRKCKNRSCTKGHDGKPKFFKPNTLLDYPRQEWCCDECKVQIALYHCRKQEGYRQKARLKAERVARKRNTQAKRDLKKNDIRHQVKLTQREFNKIIRFIDVGQPCISCDRKDIHNDVGGSWDCGHYKTIGGFPELRFCFLNAYKQCKSCNGGSGKYTRKHKTVAQDYTENLIDRMGQAVVDWLNGPHEPCHYTCEDLITMRAEFAAENRYIEKNGSPSKNWREESASLQPEFSNGQGY